MRHKLIINIKTRIHNKRQLVILELENKESIVVAPANIKQNTTLEVNELELLIGSKIRIDFYKVGEVMFNGKPCLKDNVLVKEYFIELQKPIATLRIEGREKLLPFKKIEEIFHFNKFGKDQVGIKTDDGKIMFLNVSRLETMSNLEKSEQHILIGSYINPEYYKKGDLLTDGTDVVKFDNALEWLNLRYADNIEGMHEQFENTIGYYAEEDMNSKEGGSEAFGYDSWEEMAFYEAFEGDADAWSHYNQ